MYYDNPNWKTKNYKKHWQIDRIDFSFKSVLNQHKSKTRPECRFTEHKKADKKIALDPNPIQKQLTILSIKKWL